ncbi:MAG: pyridoxamine 5'-phosphate oxidase family protein [Candidatus Nomurabacteria bacterium]|jgi:uncharacterized pyridoxamine 5'-phosphate oxidase family protein|nr:pyridoxamine 5'-phosphate oxidase family protein [Candidatus Nomurabacteria bacterium]
MEKVLDYLRGIFFIATIDGDQPRVRPFDGAAIVDNKLYIETVTGKKVYAQIAVNPKVEIFAMNDNGTLRLTAMARLADGAERDAAIAGIGKYHDGSLDTVAIFALENAAATIEAPTAEPEILSF